MTYPSKKDRGQKSQESVEILGPESALEQASKILRAKMEHLDPTELGELDWEELTDWHKDYWRFCVEDLLERSDLIKSCLRELSDDDCENWSIVQSE